MHSLAKRHLFLALLLGPLIVQASIGRLSADFRPRPASTENARPADRGAQDVWQVAYFGNSRIGYSRSFTRPALIDGKPVVKCDFESHLTLSRFGQALKVDMRRETDELSDGGLLSFAFEMKNPPANDTRASGRVVGNRLAAEMTVGGTVHEYSVPWTASVKSPAWLERLPSEHAFHPREALSCRVFLPEHSQVTDVRIAVGRRERISLPDGRRSWLLKLTVEESIAPQTPTHAYVDEHGAVLVSTTELLGQTLTTYLVAPDEALKKVAGPELDLAVSTLVGSTPIPQAHRTRRAVYRIRMRGEDPTPFFPNSDYQKVICKGLNECEVTVRSLPPVHSNRSTGVNRQYLEASRYLQIGDAQLLIHVDRAARNIVDPIPTALAMERYVHQNLQRKDFSTVLASAAEVARSLQGDCTEHAVLLAAMLRARGIPSRIVVGLVYIDPLAAFGGHMWTEALLGDRWVPLDATLGQGGTGAAHIKLADASFADSASSPMTAFLPLLHVLGRIEMTVVETSLQEPAGFMPGNQTKIK